MKIPTTGNQVKFLLDGENFFRELTHQIDRVIQAEPSERTYVRLAYWETEAEFMVDRSAEQPRTLGRMLRQAADAGHVVQLIHWKPGWLAGEILKRAWNLPKPMANYRRGASGGIQVYQEEHKGPFVLTSNHQKIAIFSIEGVVTALVGGMNLVESSYDTQTHGHTNAEGKKACLGWHDTAVLLSGPAAAAVEEEWLRRWNKQKPRLAPVKAPPQTGDESGHAVTILTTNSEARAREMDIRRSICERISTAQRYVYLENYVLSDPALVAALADRLRVKKDLAVLFVTANSPRPYSFLNRLTMLRLIIAAGGDGFIRLTHKSPRQKIEEHFKDRVVDGIDFSDPFRVPRAALLANPWFAKDVFRYTTPAGERKRVPLGSIYDAHSNRVTFACPYHDYMDKDYAGKSFYVHSKLILVDDDTAFIGSANLSFRSMVYDGEICARIAGAAARDIRVPLFKHFGLDYPDAEALQAALLSGAFSSALKPKEGEARPREGAYLKACTSRHFSSEYPAAKNIDHTFH